MRRPALVLLGALAVLCGPAASSAMDDHPAAGAHVAPGPSVSITFAAYSPAQIDVVAGDTISWTNDSVRRHTVTADDGTFDSGNVFPGNGFIHRFDVPGAVPYYCRVHPFIRGEVDVHELLLRRPAAAAGPGRPFPLSGRSALPPDTAVSIEGDTGEGFQPVATTTVDADAAFTVTVAPQTTTTYRAVAGDQVSPPVQLVVLDHAVRAAAARQRRSAVVSATVAPAAPGSTVVLQLRLRDRFGWWPVAQTRLDSASHARFTVRLRHTVPARVLLTLPDAATVLASSPTLQVGPRR